MYNLPGWEIGYHILKQPHTLIAGTTGSGKSTFLHSIIFTALSESPENVEIVMLDPKRVELMKYADLPHVVDHQKDLDGITNALKKVSVVMESRFQWMETQGETMYPGKHLIVIIDEIADLLSCRGFDVLPLLIHIGRLGRAARVHLIAATQSPDRKTLPAQMVQNFTCRIALRCLSPIESRQIINTSGAEKLPRYGHGLMLDADGIREIVIPFTDPDDIKNRIAYWN